MDTKYTSTRGGVRDVDFSTVVFSGYAPDGGLYVPQSIPIVDRDTLLKWSKLSYSRLTAQILSLYVNSKVRPHLDRICDAAFTNFESPQQPIPIKKVGQIYVVETFRGPTLAFKDIGLNILAQVMELLLSLDDNKSKKANVLVETSGDTGPAAVSSIMLNTSRVNVFCMFPYKQVTKIQARQLTTMMHKNRGNNDGRIVNVYATDRNSDDQCLIIKNIFNDTEFINKYNICAMNSINFVRIAAQICYYFYAYLQVVSNIGDEIDFAIPSGAFGNTCAASFAKAMGLPIRHLIPCCNENNIVFRTLMFGDFSSSFKDYHLTKSPAMDVQVAYNMERFFWLCFHMNGPLVAKIMKEFERNQQKMELSYRFDEILRRQFQKFIKVSYCVADAQIAEITRYFIENYNYVSCPHSACSLFGAFTFLNDKSRVQEKGQKSVPMVAISTASPAKFPNIIKGFVPEKQLTLDHRFLPRAEDKEECIKLTSDQSPNTTDNWQSRWKQRLIQDIVKTNSANVNTYRAKL